MPLYEYTCRPCEHTFETLVRGPGDRPRCPRCGNVEVAKEFSVPAAAKTAGGVASLPVCDTGPASFGCGGGRCASGMCSTD